MAIKKIEVFYIQFWLIFRKIEMILRINTKIFYPWRLQSKIAYTNNVAHVASNYNDIKAVNEPTLCN